MFESVFSSFGYIVVTKLLACMALLSNFLRNMEWPLVCLWGQHELGEAGVGLHPHPCIFSPGPCTLPYRRAQLSLSKLTSTSGPRNPHSSVSTSSLGSPCPSPFLPASTPLHKP